LNILRRLTFNLWYYHRPPWESGVVPAEVTGFIQKYPPGCALDLGCGTGTSSIALAKAGWQVTGVDFARRAIRMARRKARRAGVEVDFHVEDVLRLRGIHGPFNLVLDIGCFHGLAGKERPVYLENLEKLLAPRGFWLMYGFFKADALPGPGLLEDDLKMAARYFRLVERIDGVDKKERPSVWLLYQMTKAENKQVALRPVRQYNCRT
jgi:SAM-dependent methyltransferase